MILLIRKKKDKSVRYTAGYITFSAVLAFVAMFLYLLFMFFSRNYDKNEKNVTVISPIKTKVVLDAGHGGADGGAVSELDGVNIVEKILNLDITLMLRDFLEASGVDVILTRDSDVMLDDGGDSSRKKIRDLKARVDIADTYSDSVFISIHMNKFPAENVSGVQIYYSPNNSLSLELAQKIKKQVNELLQPDNYRELKEAGSNIYILDRIENPAVLVECGFISNTEEAKLLCSEDYRRRLVLAVGTAVLNFLSECS